MESTVTLFLLVLTAITASVYDYKWRIIPNFVTLPIMIAGLILHAVNGGFHGLLDAVSGLLLAGGLFLLLFLFGWMGAGDVKLSAAFGALIGGPQALIAVFLIIMFGGLLGLFYLLLSKFKWFRVSSTVPYGVAISLGAVYYYLLV